jgi:hypothetical protein
MGNFPTGTPLHSASPLPVRRNTSALTVTFSSCPTTRLLRIGIAPPTPRTRYPAAPSSLLDPRIP